MVNGAENPAVSLFPQHPFVLCLQHPCAFNIPGPAAPHVFAWNYGDSRGQNTLKTKKIILVLGSVMGMCCVKYQHWVYKLGSWHMVFHPEVWYLLNISKMQSGTEPWTLANVCVHGVQRSSQVLLPWGKSSTGCTGCHEKSPVLTGCSVSYRWPCSTAQGSHSCMDLGVCWELSRTLRMFGVYKTQWNRNSCSFSYSLKMIFF